MAKFIIVAFRYDSEHSVLYETAKDSSEVAELVRTALDSRNADVISIRRVFRIRLLT